MCDPQSFVSGGSDIIGGYLKADAIKTKANFEVAQLGAMKVMASAQQSSQESEVRNSIANAWQTNTAAMALSGFGNNSFDSISNAQVKDMNKGIGKMEANTKSQQGNLSTKMAVTNIAAKLEASMAKQAGWMSAANTLADAYADYQQNNTNPKLDSKNASLKKMGKTYEKSGRMMDDVIGKRASKFLDGKIGQPIERRFKSFFDGDN